MIRIIAEEDKRSTIKKKIMHSTDVFTEARDFYRDNEDYRNEQIAVTGDDGKIMYMLGWQANEITYPRLSKGVMLNLYVSQYWDYDLDSPRMDFDYIKKVDVFWFKEIEEYSVAVTKVILKYFPEKKVFFLDERAKLFFGDDVTVGEPAEEEGRTILKIGSEMIYSIHFGAEVLALRMANSINLMTSIYWMSETVSFGEANPDKVFFVIKSPIASMGLVKVISFLLFFVSVIDSKKEMKVIPVLDTAIPGDKNQFNDGKYKDVWGLFFENVTEYSLEEVYNSKNVVIGREGKMGANPYLMYVEYHSNVGPLMKKYLKLNKDVEGYCENIRKDLNIPDGSKVLGVIGRGTDFNNPGVAALHTLPLDPAGIVAKAKEYYEKGGYDIIFLATEDQKVYDTFMASELKDVTRSIAQKRYSIDPSKELLHNKYLEASESGDRSAFDEARGYISILEMLRRCDGIVASTDCGALDYAMAMRDGELADLYIHGSDSNEFLKNK